VKKGKRKEWGREEENIYGWRGYKTSCSHPDDDNSFLFPLQSRLARWSFGDFYFSRCPCHFFNSRSSPFIPRVARKLPPNIVHCPYTVHRAVLNVFCDRAIYPYCSAFSIGFQFFEGRAGRVPSLFIHGDGRRSVYQVSEGWSGCEKGFYCFFSVPLRFVTVRWICLDWIKFYLLPRNCAILYFVSISYFISW